MSALFELTKQRAKERSAVIKEQLKVISEVAIFPVDVRVPSVLGSDVIYHVPGNPEKMYDLLHPSAPSMEQHMRDLEKQLLKPIVEPTEFTGLGTIVVKEPKLIPTHFTDREGGPWVKYTGDGWVAEDLDYAVRPANILSVDKPCKLIYLVATHKFTRYHVHALAFSDPVGQPAGIYGRWDEINGWTTTIEEAEEGKINSGIRR